MYVCSDVFIHLVQSCHARLSLCQTLILFFSLTNPIHRVSRKGGRAASPHDRCAGIDLSSMHEPRNAKKHCL